MKKIILLLILSMVVYSAYAQNYDQQTNDSIRIERQDSLKEKRHELSAWIQGVCSFLQYNPTVGNYKLGLGGGVGIGYTYLFDRQWGISTGVEAVVYNAKTKITNHSDRYRVIDDEDQYNSLTLMVDIDNFEEKQQVYYLNIPLMIYYQGDGKAGNEFYASLGGKLGVPIQGNYRSTGDYVTKGQYDFTQTILENMPEHGFYTYNDLKADEKFDLDLNFQISAEVGYRWNMEEDWYIYTGLYCDYGLSDIRKVKNSPANLLQYNRENPPKYIINSIAESHYTNDKGTDNYMKKMNTLAFGIKLKFAFKMD